MLPEPINTALAAVARDLAAAGIECYVGGSAMLAIEGFDVAVGDLDIVVPAASRPQIEALFPEAEQLESHEPWRSEWLMRAEWSDGEAAVPLDLIGDLGLLIDGVVAAFPLVGERVDIGDGASVVLAPLRHWYHLYRVHAPEKAAMIAEWLTDSEIVAGAAELGIGSIFSPTLIVRIGNDSSQEVIEEGMTSEQQSSIIEVASPTDLSFDEPGSEVIDLDLLNETLEYIRPALQADGGDLVMLGTEGGKVTLQMVGACGGCPLSTMTLTAGIERILKDRVPGVTEVVAI